MLNRPKVYVIILNWNGWRDTLECLASLEQQDYPNFEAVVIDNCSTDDSVQRMRIAYPALKLIENPKNLGFTGGNNTGIEYAIRNGAKYTLLLNNDTIVNDPGLISKLVDIAGSDLSIGLLCPTIFFTNPPDRVWYAGSELSLWTGWKHIYKLPPSNNISDTGYATGCCVLASVDFINQVGNLAEDYFLSVEDIEWSIRAKRAGWRVVYTPQTSIHHKDSISSGDPSKQGKFSPTRVYYEHRNSIWLIQEYGNVLQKWFVWPVFFALQLSYKSAAYILLRRWPKLFSLFRAIRDGLKGRPKSPNGLLSKSLS